MRRRTPVEAQLSALFKEHPRSAEWSAADLAEHLRRTPRAIKEAAVFRKREAESQGVLLTEADSRILVALAALTSEGGMAIVRQVAKEARRSYSLTRRRLSGLVKMGYAASRIGEGGGYVVTERGKKTLRRMQR